MYLFDIFSIFSYQLTLNASLKRMSCLFFVVKEDELKRLRLAFKRIAGASGVMSKTLFIREVLGDAVPIKLAEVNMM